MLAWRTASEADQEQTTVNSLTRAQFNDHIPEVLTAFEARLRARPGGNRAAMADEQQKLEEVKHGLHRWQQGYRLREVTREWGYLHLCLNDELESFAAEQPAARGEMRTIANRELIKLVSSAISESTAQYARLEQEEAAGRARDLELALAELSELEHRRTELIRQAVHDLGGNVQAVSSAASLLGYMDIEESERREFADVVQRGIGAVSTMLKDLTSLARLEAGEERRKITSFDAATVLTELCAVSQSLAAERGLWLQTKGPAPLLVDGDADKVRRIAQNLVFNALKYTERGGVTVSWNEEGAGNWWLAVEDTGPGVLGGPGAPIVMGLKEATASARETDKKAAECSGESTHVLPQPSMGSNFVAPKQQAGEGIGLSIVKRLCELLDASLELASSSHSGTTFRVLLPRRYEKAG